jgi:hypothetical protein
MATLHPLTSNPSALRCSQAICQSDISEARSKITSARISGPNLEKIAMNSPEFQRCALRRIRASLGKTTGSARISRKNQSPIDPHSPARMTVARASRENEARNRASLKKRRETARGVPETGGERPSHAPMTNWQSLHQARDVTANRTNGASNPRPKCDLLLRVSFCIDWKCLPPRQRPAR